MADEERLIEGVARIARPLRDDGDLDPLLDRIGDARVVLLGEAPHGTHEFYTWRDRITRRLITEKGFGFMAVEGDWPDCSSSRSRCPPTCRMRRTRRRRIRAECTAEKCVST